MLSIHIKIYLSDTMINARVYSCVKEHDNRIRTIVTPIKNILLGNVLVDTYTTSIIFCKRIWVHIRAIINT